MAKEEPSKGRVLVTTGNHIEGYGRSRNTSAWCGASWCGHRPSDRESAAGFSSIFGGNIKAWEEVCEPARSDAYKRMVDHARDKGADGVIAMRYDATEFAAGVTEVLAYGTAVRLTDAPINTAEAVRLRGKPCHPPLHPIACWGTRSSMGPRTWPSTNCCSTMRLPAWARSVSTGGPNPPSASGTSSRTPLAFPACPGSAGPRAG